MGIYRICKAFTVESGHMLSKHPESCRIPHGHTRRIEVVLSARELNKNEMVVDFKALKLAVSDLVEQFDHSMAVNSQDPACGELQARFGSGVVVFEDQDPTTEVLAEHLFSRISSILQSGWEGRANSGVSYAIPAGRVTLERVRVWETPTAWAEYASDSL